MSPFSSTVQTRRRTRLATALTLALGLGAGQAIGADSSTSGPAAPTAMEVHRAATGLPVDDDIISVLTRSAATGDLGSPFAQVATRLGAAQAARAAGTVITVTNCNDSGSGSLREAVSDAMSGDTVDISGVSCGDIKLTSSIITTVDDLTIKGDPDRKYGIDGQNTVRPIAHAGTGTLTLDGVMVKNGIITSATQTAAGGCIYSKGDVYLANESQVKYCSAINTNPAPAADADAQGGGVFAKGTLTMANSAVAYGTAKSDSGLAAGGNIHADKVVIVSGTINGGVANGGIVSQGGGIYAKSGFMGKYASIHDNKANGGVIGNGGGLWIGSGEHIQLKYSTVNGNTARGAAGLAIGYLANDGDALTIQSSTIANNNSTATERHYGGAVFAGTDTVTINNTTISGNIESNASNKKYGAGLRIKPGVTATLSSTVVGGNMLKKTDSSTSPDDLTAADFSGSEPVNGTIVGDHNFISVRLNTYVPTDTLGLGAGFIPLDPMLGPLADNGGYTRTMLPKPDSPLIDAGNDNGLTKDQRGSGFPRIVGPASDIGAIEANDIIFANGFD